MSNLIVTVNTAKAPTGSKAKPSKIWRRKARQAIKKLMNACRVVQNMDTRAFEHAAFGGYEPLLFIGSPGSGRDTALRTLLNACSQALTETT